MKQTAVEWLYERLERMIPRTALYNIDKKEYFEQAKEMEKQQIFDARLKGIFEGIDCEQKQNSVLQQFRKKNDYEK